MNKSALLKSGFMLSVFMLALFSCEKMLDVDVKDKLEAEKGYKNEFDARSAALGINGLFQEKMADNYFLMNELRGDLMDVTYNANEYLHDISTHQADVNNPYVHPEDYYAVILACNEAVSNILKLDMDTTLAYDNSCRFFSLRCMPHTIPTPDSHHLAHV